MRIVLAGLAEEIVLEYRAKGFLLSRPHSTFSLTPLMPLCSRNSRSWRRSVFDIMNLSSSLCLLCRNLRLR